MSTGAVIIIPSDTVMVIGSAVDAFRATVKNIKIVKTPTMPWTGIGQAMERAAETVSEFTGSYDLTAWAWAEFPREPENYIQSIRVRKDKRRRPVYEVSQLIDEESGSIIGMGWRFLYHRFGISEARASVAAPVAAVVRRISPRHNRRGWTGRSY